MTEPKFPMWLCAAIVGAQIAFLISAEATYTMTRNLMLSNSFAGLAVFGIIPVHVIGFVHELRTHKYRNRREAK